MTGRPILFSSPMVRALLAGTKTQTRRLATSKPTQRMDIGDRLWVREAWRTESGFDSLNPSKISPDPLAIEWLADELQMYSGRYRHSHFMPRWASRLTLTVTDKRAQLLQDISAADSIAEGVKCPNCYAIMAAGGKSACRGMGCFASKDAYRALWNSLHTKAGERWDDNPEVIAVTFDVQRGNIDGGVVK